MANRFEGSTNNAHAEEAERDGQTFERHIMDGDCPVTAVQELEVTVPATVRAHAEIGRVNLRCVGAGIVVGNSDEVRGRPNAVSRFTIRQRLRVDIPVKFEAEAYVGEGHVDYEAVDVRECENALI